MKHFFIFLVWGILAVNLWAQTDLWGPEGAWPMFQADSRHSGRSSFAGPQTPNLLWSKKIADQICPRTSLVVSYGQIYISADNGLYAVDADGTVNWIFPSGNITSTAALGHFVYFGSNDTLCALDHSGKLQWSYKADSPLKSPIIAGYPPKVYFTSEHKLYSLEPSNGYPIFIADIAGSVVVGSAATKDLAPNIYVATLGQSWPMPWYDFRLYSFGNGGNQNWKFEVLRFEPGGVNSVPTIADDGTVYVTTTWLPGWTSRLYAISPAGEEKWTYGAYQEKFYCSSPAIASDGAIYIGNGDGLLAINADGSFKWESPIGSVQYSAPAIGVDGIIYLGTDAGKFYAINPDGTEKWHYNTGTSSLGSPAIGASGTAYVVSEEGILYVFGGSVVPVELSSFTASIGGNNIILHWSTASETNNFGFEIERSQDKVNFTRIGFVTGHGMSAVPNSYSFMDCELANGVYYYRLKQIDVDGSSDYSNIIKAVMTPASFYLSQNFPNPFNSTTEFEYNIAKPGLVNISIFNLRGQQVADLVNTHREVGEYRVSWNAGNLPSGVYFYRIMAKNFMATKRMILMR